MSGYKTIDTTPREADGSQVVSFDVDEVPVDTAVETEVKTAEKPVEAAKPAEPVVQEQPKEQRQSRAQKRIKELHAQKSEVEGLLLKERAARAELERQLLQGHTSTKESFKTTLEGQIKSLTSQMASAMTNGDSNLVVQLQDDLINAKLELATLNRDLAANHQEIKKAESVAANTPAPQNKVPERAMEWIAEHPEFKTDELFYNATIVTNNQLLREGWDPESDEFYAEIDKRLGKRFPEMFGIDDKNSVQLRVDTNSSDFKQPDVKAQVVDVAPATITRERTVEQTVSGSSRPSANTITQRKSTQVTLSAQDVKQAEAWGLSLEQMARRIAHAEANKGNNGYVPINMKH